jgi:acetyl/propionyl-CoA carboxylase alpha subunit
LARTCRDLGITSVAVFSDADQDAPHVLACDQAVRIGPAPAHESYLAIDKLVAAARQAGADAVHPGYGFLAESAEFAEACTAAGLCFIGPPAQVIAALGSKREARELAERAQVPVVPSWPADAAAASAAGIQYPVLIKASAGGGGRGMRVVREAAELGPALESARREAALAFGDDTLLVERYLERTRHVEIQIFGDQQGNLVHLFERECSVQRRHQKLLEESPSPAVSPALREEMAAAALRLAREVGYQSAGTVEFLLAEDGAFYLLEVNTRLQVEHPVTELVTGLDLVAEQIRVARGEPLSFAGRALQRNGHAIECRLYAEDPAADFLPSSGRLLAWQIPQAAGLRVDAGVTEGSQVTIHYDPTLAKLVCHAPTRAEALARLALALERTVALGIATNRQLLIDVLRHPEFAAGRFDTHFLARHRSDLQDRPAPSGELARAAIAATLAGAEARRGRRPVLPELPLGWRNNRGPDPSVRLRARDRELEVCYRDLGAGRFDCRVDGEPHPVRVLLRAGEIALEDAAGVVRRFRVASHGLSHHVHAGPRDVAFSEAPIFPDQSAVRAEGSLTAPMPGRVVKLLVAAGDDCHQGQPLVLLEAMKMEHAVLATRDGRIARIRVAEGDPVDAGAPLVELE